MTTREFIEREYTHAGKEKWCSSVFKDSGGWIYSYGYHYPLAFRLQNHDFVNDAGYSVTTAKHINWAKQALGYSYTAVKLNRDDAYKLTSGSYSEDEKLKVVVDALHRELGQIIGQLESKKRKDTWVYSDLQSQHERVYNSIQQLEVRKGVEVW